MLRPFLGTDFPRCLSKNFVTTSYSSRDSGKSTSRKKPCHIPSQICRSASTPALTSRRWVYMISLIAISRVPETSNVGGNRDSTSNETTGATSGSVGLVPLI